MARKTLYNAKGSPAAEAAEKERGDGFKRGGSTKKRAGGGSIPARKHGGSVRAMSSKGGSPMSSGHLGGAAADGKQSGSVY